MNIYYQGHEGAYSHITALKVKEKYDNIENIIGVFSFKDMFDEVVKNNGMGIVPIENSYAGSVHENFYNLINYKVKIIGEHFLEIKHCLASTGNNIKNIKYAYSHYQALMQCENYLKNHHIEAKVFGDTAGAAKYVKEQNNPEYASISSELAANIYGLNILEKGINDQKGNNTRFFIVTKNETNLKTFSNNKKISIVFKVKDMPAVLYKCLGAFATRNINLTKIESLSTKEKQFEYMFWIDLEKPRTNQILEGALNELSYFAKEIKILGEY